MGAALSTRAQAAFLWPQPQRETTPLDQLVVHSSLPNRRACWTFNRLLGVPECHGHVISRRQQLTTLLRMPEPSYPFRSVSHDAPRESWGRRLWIALGLAIHSYFFSALPSVLSPYINCCPGQKEASLMKTEKGAKL